MFDDKTILITGGTGSFGQHFTRHLLSHHRPRKVIILSRDELKQSEMQQRFASQEMRYFIGDVRDGERLRRAFSGVDYVVHAAALKQVPAAEYNPMEAVRTNVEGGQNVIEAALDAEVDKVVALSTDKAANPINLYGATKLTSDKLFVAGNNMAGGHRTRFSVVRYGNVVGSRGSVVPFFQQQIDAGAECLPITSEEMTRFWITLDEGVEFVRNAFRRMRGGEIFVPKIPSVRIVDVATAMAPHLPYEIIGVRPGEKLHEVMCPADDAHLTLEFDDHYVIQPTIRYHQREVGFAVNAVGESGERVPAGFEYNSGSNARFLSVQEIRDFHARAGL